MKRVISLLLFWGTLLFAGHVEPEDRYLHLQSKQIELIGPEVYRDRFASILQREAKVLKRYRSLFGWSLDDTLRLVLASPKNQIANAFSTQIPLNMQVDYIGGSLMPDYFATTSWLQTLFVHESAHNFQLNAKNNPLSRIGHQVFKNTPVVWLYFAPVFILPNLLESNFVLEGNAVLNESLWGNGGRLYNGIFKAMTLLQHKAGYITPQRVYNDTLFYPYGTHHYIVGGFFQLYLARRYGLPKVDHYFLAFSDQWLPFFTNSVSRRHFGKDFESLIREFDRSLEKEAALFQQSKGEVLCKSKSAIPLASDAEEIRFLITDDRSKPLLVRLDKKSGKMIRKKGAWRLGKVFATPRDYVTRASARVGVDQVAVALFDANARALPGTLFKAYQVYGKPHEALYFDVNTSFDGFRLYRNGKFLDIVNSSVITDREGNYYAFRQKGATRTLVKNGQPLFSFTGYFAKPVDVDEEGGVWFVANSAHGATLYRYRNGAVSRLVPGDDVIDARVIDSKTALLEVQRADGVAFLRTPIVPKKATVHETHYFFENMFHEANLSNEIAKPEGTPKPYKAWQNLHYSALEPSITINDDDSVDFSLSASFSDPLGYNNVRLFTSTYGDENVAGIGYDNSAFRTPFGLSFYGVWSHAKQVRERGYGISGYLDYPIFTYGYERSDLRFDGYLDSDKNAKSPVALRWFWKKREQFGHARYPAFFTKLTLFGTEDRGDYAYGARLGWMQEIGHELYAGADLHYAKSSTERAGRYQRGIWIDESEVSYKSDPARFVMPSLKFDIYADDAFKGEVSLAKVLNFSRYYFSFPLSLRRETLYGKYRYFRLGGEGRHYRFNEYTLGLNLELLALHKAVVPFSIEWLKNDNLRDPRKVRLFFTVQF